MKKFFQYLFFVTALPFIVAGVVWYFITDAFKVGKEVGDTFFDYLGED